MKFTIVVNQRVVADVNEKIEDKRKRLDLVDCSILEWVVQICTSRDSRISSARQDGMTWVSYQKLIDDMPLLGITTKGGIAKRLAKLKDGGFIRITTIHQRTYVDYTLKAEKLSYDYGASKPFPVGNTSTQTVSPGKHNRFPQETNKNTRTSINKKLKIHERKRNVNDNLGVTGFARAKATKDWLTERTAGQTFADFFKSNRGRYITV